MTTWYDRNSPTRYGPDYCPHCNGFPYLQPEPGKFIVCDACRGSSVRSITGDRDPREVVRNSRYDSTPGLGERDVVQASHESFLEGFR